MKKAIWWLISILGLGLFAVIIYYALLKLKPQPVI